MNERKKRIIFLLILVFAIAGVIGAKLLYVQVFNNRLYAQGGSGTRLQEIAITPDRGTIYDRNGETLAVSVELKSVYISPSEIRAMKTDGQEKVIGFLAKELKLKKSKIREAVARTDTDFVWLKRHADPKVTKRIEKGNYIGVGLTPEFKREYPNGRLASQVLGFAGIDNQGLSGVELQYNDTLSGTPGKLQVEYDGKGNIIPQSIRESVPAIPGDDIYLTIDRTIQYIVERELRKAVKVYKPLQITCIVQDVNDGSILAMAGMPDFDPNDYNASKKETWNNLSVSKVYEPGSVFKVFSTSMYLDDGVATPESQYYCPGSIMIDGHELRCWTYPNGQGAETLKQGFAQSCNIVQAKSVARLGAQRFYDYLGGFGMTKRTGIDLPAESSPVLVPKDEVVPLDLAAMAIGQANAYTPIQMINGLSAVVNGGTLYRPQIVKKETDRSGRVLKEHQADPVRRIVSEQTAAEMRDMCEYVVTDGIGKSSAIPGYRVGGKTGTAEIASKAGYERGNYNLSFGGFAPVNDPKIACLVVVNSPQTNDSSGAVVGPIFSAIVGDIMRYYDIPSTLPSKNIEEGTMKHIVEVPDVPLPANAEGVRQALASQGFQVDIVGSGSQALSYLPLPKSKVATGSTITLYCGEPEAEVVTLPDFSGRTIKEVDVVLSSYGLRADLSGSGLAWSQNPVAQAVVRRGSTVTVRFASSRERQNIAKLQEEEARRAEAAAKEAQAKAAAAAQGINGASAGTTG